ncbi:MAG: hypothetical protein ACR2FU_17730 [Streptosporangiaceae bacterium]
MNAGQLAALVAAAFFAVAMCAAVYVLAKLGGLIGAATSLVTSYQAGTEELLARGRATVDRADAQLARTGALADGVDEVAASMSELSEQVSAVAGTARVIATGLGTPVLRLAAAGHGVRYALALRRSGQADGGPGLTSPARLRALPDDIVRDEPGTALTARSGAAALAGRSGPAAGEGGTADGQARSWRTDRVAARSGSSPRRESWRERAERVRAARDGAQR